MDDYRAGALEELLDRVCDQRTFVAFVLARSQDFARERRMEEAHPSPPYSSGKLGWENGTVDTVFDAAAAFGDETSEAWEASHGQNIWRRCAEILIAGKYYE